MGERSGQCISVASALSLMTHSEPIEKERGEGFAYLFED